ncbi:MAG: helix-turn-helix transcriptional regulator [Clostridia bacterium]|nr:helix-turn-helix transcriptional regulator [Clostridia bacterium]
MENLNEIVAKNIATYRKMNGLTQSQLADKLNFSDKSISKWERAEAVPDVGVLMQMSKIFGVTLNDMVSDKIAKKPKLWRFEMHNKKVITLMSVGLVWLVATLVFVSHLLLWPEVSKAWLCFVYAAPVSEIVLLVFSCLWNKKWVKFVHISLLIWTVLVAICLTFPYNVWNLMYIGIPLQVLTLLWSSLKRKMKEKKMKEEEKDENA